MAHLDAGRDLTEAERLSECLGPSSSTNLGERCGLMSPSYPERLVEERNASLSHPEMKSVKLAVRAHIAFGPFPITVIKIGVESAGPGTMSVTANVNGYGPRQARIFRLTSNEIDHLLAALNRSQFWRLPTEVRRQGPTGGEAATVEVSVSGLKHHVTDLVGDSDAADLSVLVNAISVIAAGHWQGVPGT